MVDRKRKTQNKKKVDNLEFSEIQNFNARFALNRPKKPQEMKFLKFCIQEIFLLITKIRK